MDAAVPTVYAPCSGTLYKEILNPPSVVPKAVYDPLYSLST